jgi:hypothetical protein
MKIDLAESLKHGHSTPEMNEIVVCPVCGGEYSWVAGTTEIDGKDRYASGYGVRGDVLIVNFKGECGHVWGVCFGFHKGNTHTSVVYDDGSESGE